MSDKPLCQRAPLDAQRQDWHRRASKAARSEQLLRMELDLQLIDLVCSGKPVKALDHG